MIKLFHGNNEFDLHEGIKVIKTDLFSADLSDPNTTVFQAPDIKFPHLGSIVSTVPFMADYRFVMVEGLLSSVEARKRGSSTALLELENVLKACPPTTYLIFTENIKLRSTGKMIKLIQQFAEIKEFELPRGREVNGWIKNRLVKLNGKATEKAISKLGFILGNDLRLIDQELKKLILFSDNKMIEVSDVNTLVTEAREGNIFTAIDAIFEKKSASALRQLIKLLDQGSTVGSIISMLSRQTRLMILTIDISKIESDPWEIGKRIGVSNRFALNKIINQSRHYNSEFLYQVHRKLLDTDVAIKRGIIDENVAIEILVSDLSG